MFIERQPMGRLATAEELAEMVVYLASESADFVTGQTMVVDGGMCLQIYFQGGLGNEVGTVWTSWTGKAWPN